MNIQCCRKSCSVLYPLLLPQDQYPRPTAGTPMLHKTTPHCRSTPQACDTRIRSLVKHSKNKSNTVVSVLLKTLRFTPQRIKSGKNPRVLSLGGATLHYNLQQGFAFLMPGTHAPNLYFEALWSLSQCV